METMSTFRRSNWEETVLHRSSLRPALLSRAHGFPRTDSGSPIRLMSVSET